MQGNTLDERLAALATLSLPQLRDVWRRITDKPLPRVSAALLRLALAWELQAFVHGGLSRRTQQTLDQLARGNTRTRATQPGMRLMREWNGTLHVVTVEDDGTIRWVLSVIERTVRLRRSSGHFA